MGALVPMAQRIADDGGAPVRDREHAMAVLHRLLRDARIDPQDEWRLRMAHAQRQRDALTLARLYELTRC